MHGVLTMRLVLAFIVALLVGPAFAQFNVGGPVTNNTATGTNRVLCSVRGANMNTTADQACTIPASVTAWAPLSVLATNCTGTLTLAVGGFYPAASKAGTPLVAATQAYSALTTSAFVLVTTLAAGIATNRYTINTTYLSLTTAAGGAATCDIYLTGTDLS